MQPRSLHARRLALLFVASGALFFAAPALEAASYTLTSNSPVASWSDAATWNNATDTKYPGQSPGDVVTIVLNGNTLNVDLVLPNPVQVNISGNGTVAANSALTLTGSSTWSSGTVTGSGGVTIAPGATLNLNGSGAVLDGTTLTNNGTIALTSASANALALAHAAKITNGGVVDVQNDGAMTSDASATAINSSGTIEKTAGAGTATIAPDVVSLGAVVAKAGTLAFGGFGQFAPGSTELSGGNLASPSIMDFRGGKILGGGTIDATVYLTFTNVEPGRGIAPATLNISGDLKQSGGALIVDCFANGVTDKYVIRGAFGAFDVRLLFFGGYDPANGDRFDNVITGSNLSPNSTYHYFPFGHNGTGRIQQTVTSTSISYYATWPTADLAVSAIVGTNAPPATTYPVTLTVQNRGTAYASGLNIALAIANGSIASTSSSSFTCGGSGASSTCTILPAVFAIANDASVSVTVNVTVPSGTATLTGSVTGNEFDPNTADNSVTVTVPGAATADIAVAIADSPDPVYAGQPVTYTYTVTNAGPAASTATLSATIGNGTISSAGAGCVQNTGTVATCTSPSIASGGSATFTITAKTPPIGTMTAAATVTPPDGVGDPNVKNNSTSESTTVNPSADLSVTTDAPATVLPGGTITYTLHVANLGPSDAGIIVDDPTPAGLTFVKSDGCYSFPCNLGPVLAGTKRTITAVYNVAANLTGIVGNTATVSSFIADPVPGNNTSHVSTIVSTPQGCTTGTPDAPVPAVAASVLSGETYYVQWPAVDGATQYEVEEAADANFLTPTPPRTVTTTVVSYGHGTLVGTVTFYYRVRAYSACSQQFSGYSPTVYVMISPEVKRRAVRP